MTATMPLYPNLGQMMTRRPWDMPDRQASITATNFQAVIHSHKFCLGDPWNSWNSPPVKSFLAPRSEVVENSKRHGGGTHARPIVPRLPPGNDRRQQLYRAQAYQLDDAHLDAVAVNMGKLSGGNIENYEAIQAAMDNASERQMKVFASIDFAAMTDYGMGSADAQAEYFAKRRNRPSTYRIKGRPVVTSFGGERPPPEWWARYRATFKKVAGEDPYILLMFHSRFGMGYNAVADAISWFGPHSWDLGKRNRERAAQLHTAGRPAWPPIVPQDSRPKDGIYFEARESHLMFDCFAAAMETKQPGDGLFFVTENDEGEATTFWPTEQVPGVAYYPASGHALYDLMSWMILTYKGIPTPFVRDVGYGWHRVIRRNTKQSMTSDVGPERWRRAGDVGDDGYWYVDTRWALTEPAKVRLIIGDDNGIEVDRTSNELPAQDLMAARFRCRVPNASADTPPTAPIRMELIRQGQERRGWTSPYRLYGQEIPYKTHRLGVFATSEIDGVTLPDSPPPPPPPPDPPIDPDPPVDPDPPPPGPPINPPPNELIVLHEANLPPLPPGRGYDVSIEGTRLTVRLTPE